MSQPGAGLHVVLSYGDVFRQSGYRTKVLGELQQYERHAKLEPFLIAFDRDANRIDELNLGSNIRVKAHPRTVLPIAVLHYLRDLASLQRIAPVRTVHAHNLYSGAIGLIGRWRFGYKLIVELHGRIPEEYVILRKGGRLSYRFLKWLESWVMRNADHIIPISHKLKDYLISEYRLHPHTLTVIPDCADPAVFRWDPAMRQSGRQRLGVDGKLVCVHLGSVFIWYDPELIVETFTRIRTRIPSAHLLIVTEDTARVAAYVDGKLPKETVTIMAVPHEQVPNLLAASDLGLLLLRSTANIEVSSPAKFSEYLNSGVPVLITERVGDFSAVVADERVGTIVADDGSFDLTFLDEVLANRTGLAERCVGSGTHLTWQAFYQAWSDILAKLGGNCRGGHSPTL
jgi:glycosyltransferase involved in cell wall biosynthesis